MMFRLRVTGVPSGAISVGFACVLTMAGCTSSSRPETAQKPPRVQVPGVITPGSASRSSQGTTAPGRSAPTSQRRYGPAGSHGVVLLGGWAPGGAGNPVAAGATAYFKWLNARGGVYGNLISYHVLDDHGNAAEVPSLAHALVQDDAVFAVFGAQGGVSEGPAVQFLNASAVPDVFTGTGCDCLSAPGELPDEFGWSLSSAREGKILGAYASQRYSGQPTAVLYAPGAAGTAELHGFTGDSKARVVYRSAIASGNSASTAVTASKSRGARLVVVLAPAPVTTAVNDAMSAVHLRVPVLAASSGLGTGLPDGTITDGFLPSPGAQADSPSGSWIKLFRQIQHAYLPQAALSLQMIEGMSAAYDMASAMFAAGPTLTRQGILTALSGISPGPSAAPLAFSLVDHAGPTGAYIGTVRDGSLVPVTGVFVTSALESGSVESYRYPSQAAPSGGIPPS